ncbi:hypothetical protein SUGI_0370870 [Cryptomeria japonica]|uniref:UPF0481 protein At3g47200 n=1 Tax=Cryptomeria japonica TaxID=3369 RepID=UPI002408B817|nr:UPF0481 protein At3g47200 [Cryptomeria japonica]GLJ20418.1 hypothetical protein SUGI_0370870 [Cryptomeria japonica]
MAALASEEQQLISEEWTVEIESFLTESEKPLLIRKASMRVPKAFINAKQEAYIPQMLSLGPYHYRSLQDQAVAPYHQRLSHLSQMDFYKLKSARDASKVKPDLISNFFTRVSEMVQEFEEFYDWKIKDRKKFGQMMMLDAFFLYQFLKNVFHVFQHDATERHIGCSEILKPTLTSIKCDIVKLENQIPFSLVKQIDSDLNSNTVQTFLNTQISGLSCFEVSHDVKDIDYKGENHLLGCMHKYVSSLLKIDNTNEDKPRNSTYYEQLMTVKDDIVAALLALFFPHPARGRNDFLSRYNAKELVKGGILFKSGSDKIRFDKHSDTLFLPKIVISETYTEVLMRNLLALELNDVTRSKNVTQYVELMDCLIDTPEDVALLRECHVINRQSMMITDEQITKMWDGMGKPLFFAGFEEHSQEIKSGIRETLIKKYYKSKVRNWWVEFHGEHLSRPWKMLALCTAVLVVVLTAAQTYCSFAECQKKS